MATIVDGMMKIAFDMLMFIGQGIELYELGHYVATLQVGYYVQYWLLAFCQLKGCDNAEVIHQDASGRAIE